MDSLGLFFPGCAPFSQIEISGSFLVAAHLQHRSSNLRFLSGVSILGPLLFVLYTEDIQHIAEGFNLGVHCYADDGQLYFYDRVQALPGVISKVVSCIAEIESWMNSNRLKLNSEKTPFIWLVRISTTSISLGACTVDSLKIVNDLGVTIDCQLISMKDHVQRV